MVQLEFLSGKMAGQTKSVRHFPFKLGRGSGCDVALKDKGVWKAHCQLDLENHRIRATRLNPESLLLVDGEPVQGSELANGSLIQIGEAQIRFLLSPTVPKNFKFRETMLWVGLAFLAFSQVLLIYLL